MAKKGRRSAREARQTRKGLIAKSSSAPPKPLRGGERASSSSSAVRSFPVLDVLMAERLTSSMKSTPLTKPRSRIGGQALTRSPQGVLGQASVTPSPSKPVRRSTPNGGVTSPAPRRSAVAATIQTSSASSEASPSSRLSPRKPEVRPMTMTVPRQVEPSTTGEEKTPRHCKARPDSAQARKGDGGSRPFIPWCS